MNPHHPPDDPIRHVVLLLFENRSFDHMLGSFRSVYPELDGVDPAHPGVNEAGGKEYRQAATAERQMNLDPRHDLKHVRRQLADHNGGFVADFVESYPNSTPDQRRLIMAYYELDTLPALHALARDFLVCDHWFASLPGPTWPNRLFALSGTSQGKAAMPSEGGHWFTLFGWLNQEQPTIFDRLSEKDISWKVFFHDIPQSVCLTHQRRPENLARYHTIGQFFRAAREPEPGFPSFCFIEPDYYGADQNDDHPPYDVFRAQKLLADVYNALRANDALWQSTLLVVLYDEHGGFYDHVEPPAAVPPAPPQPGWEYTFDRLGVRVPAVLVSPHVERGCCSTCFDHTSLLKYLIEKWDLGPLGERTAHAASLGPLIRAAGPRSDTVPRIHLTPERLLPPSLELDEAAQAHISEHHQALALLGSALRREMLRDGPLWYALIFAVVETLMQKFLLLFGKHGAHAAYRRAERHWTNYHRHRQHQGVDVLSERVRDPNERPTRRHFAAEALGGVVGQAFHLETDPSAAAAAWLDRQDSQIAAQPKEPRTK